MNNIISLSGGKDSTAMLLMMIERKEPIHSIIFLDTGWEFPEMLKHIDLLEKQIGIKIWRLHPRLPFDFLMTRRPVRSREKRNIKYIGCGWPSPLRRWCTREKVGTLSYYCKAIPNIVNCIGYATDEKHRKIPERKGNFRFPLQEWNITEANALQYCYNKGYNWDGLYEIFSRVSCYCCPLQKIGTLKKLRKHFPNLWQGMLKMDKAILINKGFRDCNTVHDLEKRFSKEDKVEKRIIDFCN